MEYFSTFLTGFGNLVTEQLKTQVPDVKIHILLDGLVSYSTQTNQSTLINLNFLNNTYIQLKFLKTDKQNPKPPFLSGPNIWTIQRSEGFLFSGEKIVTEAKPYLEKGQLKEELAYLMNLLSEPNLDDVFLDPFAGSGAIAIERLKLPVKKILAGDNNNKLSDRLKSKAQKERLPITVGKWDALHLESFENESINKIITDPPWGIHLGKRLDLQMFYSKMLKEFFRVLKPGGILVLLVSNKELMEKLLREHSNRFELLEKYSTLVSGQKANVLKIKKSATI